MKSVQKHYASDKRLYAPRR